MEEINKILQEFYFFLTQERVDEEYDTMIDMMCAEHDLMMYSCHSYDEV